MQLNTTAWSKERDACRLAKDSVNVLLTAGNFYEVLLRPEKKIFFLDLGFK